MKNTKPMSKYFAENLDAPLTNVQWSWGAENEKAIYLRVWLDEIENDEKVFLLQNSTIEKRLGHLERQKQMKSISQGKPGYVVVISEWTDTPDGNRNITAFKEAVFKIQDFVSDESGNIWGLVNFKDPIFPQHVGSEIDVAAIKEAALKNMKASELLTKAMEKFDWKPTGICAQQNIISLLSCCGKLHAEINILEGTWKRH